MNDYGAMTAKEIGTDYAEWFSKVEAKASEKDPAFVPMDEDEMHCMSEDYWWASLDDRW